MKRLLAFVLFSTALFAASPDCVLYFGAGGGSPFIAPGTVQFSNKGKSCYDWRISYNAQGFSALSIVVQVAPDVSGSPGAWVSFTSPEATNPIQGVNPNTSTTGASSYFRGSPAWVRVNLTAVTGSGSVSGILYGCQEPGCGSGMATASSVGPPGSVTSVGLALPNIFNVTGSPVTTTGTLTGALATQTANTFFAGPASAGPTAPTFRTLVAADLPPPNACGAITNCATGSLVQSQIIALAGTPVVAIAAQGAGTAIVIDSFNCQLVFNNAAYAAGNNLSLKYPSSGTSIFSCPTATFTAVVNSFATSVGASTNYGAAATNTAVNLTVTSTNFTCPSTCGTITYWIRYHVLTGVV